jgi:hypothetical protein
VPGDRNLGARISVFRDVALDERVQILDPMRIEA